jgi:exopolyphosphatase/guanosine-5'-triphosphate,3'-diphosphate pyrophosphatase
MEKIIPRWEWRSFGSGFGAADRTFAALTPDGVLESDEVYLLSSASGDNIKIRDRLMDVKALQQVNADGLEQWKPVLKGSFPLAAADVAKVFAAFRVPAPALARPAYTLDEFVAELMDARRGLRALPVHKSRRRFKIDGCMSEWTEVTAGGKKILTVALESEDPALVVATVRKMGLAGLPNVNYTKGLKQLVGMPT